ncbi:MAG: methyltransferase domain-containing protein [Nitrospinae bacterium]|nr:methyltransferase domain-containing protein [Nitrospinota bacterium]
MKKIKQHLLAYQQNYQYKRENQYISERFAQRVLECANGESLLELGIGNGSVTKMLSERFKRHLIVEGAGELIQQFNKNNNINGEVIESLFETFTTNELFDNILMGFILEHVENPQELLERYKKFMHKDASVFLSVPNGESLNRRIGYEAGLLDSCTELSKTDKEIGHKRVFTLETISKMVHSSGFSIVRKEGLYLKPFATEQLELLGLEKKVHQALIKTGTHYPELSVAIFMEIKLRKNA